MGPNNEHIQTCSAPKGNVFLGGYLSKRSIFLKIFNPYAAGG